MLLTSLTKNKQSQDCIFVWTVLHLQCVHSTAWGFGFTSAMEAGEKVRQRQSHLAVLRGPVWSTCKDTRGLLGGARCGLLSHGQVYRHPGSEAPHTQILSASLRRALPPSRCWEHSPTPLFSEVHVREALLLVRPPNRIAERTDESADVDVCRVKQSPMQTRCVGGWKTHYYVCVHMCIAGASVC